MAQREALAAFDGDALIRALDAQRAGRELMWNTLADVLWRQSADLNERLGGGGVCSPALRPTAKRKNPSCPNSRKLLRWRRRPPGGLLIRPGPHVRTPAPPAAR